MSSSLFKSLTYDKRSRFCLFSCSALALVGAFILWMIKEYDATRPLVFRHLNVSLNDNTVFDGNWHARIESHFPINPSSFYFHKLSGNPSICKYLLFQTRSNDHPVFLFTESTLADYAHRNEHTCAINFSCRSYDSCGKPHFYRYYAIWRLMTSEKTFFPKLTHIYYLDTDAFIIRPDFDVEDVIHAVLGDYNEISISVDHACHKYQFAPVNSGSIVLKVGDLTTLLVASLLVEWETVYHAMKHQKWEGQILPGGRFSTNSWEAGDQSTMTYLYEATGLIGVNRIENYCRQKLKEHLDYISSLFPLDNRERFPDGVKTLLKKHPVVSKHSFYTHSDIVHMSPLYESKKFFLEVEDNQVNDWIGYPSSSSSTRMEAVRNANVTIYEQGGGRVINGWLTNAACRAMGDVMPDSQCQAGSFAVHLMGESNLRRQQMIVYLCDNLKRIHALRHPETSELAFCSTEYEKLRTKKPDASGESDESFNANTLEEFSHFFTVRYLDEINQYLHKEKGADVVALLNPQNEPENPQFCQDVLTKDFSFVHDENKIRGITGSQNEIVCTQPISRETTIMAFKEILTRRILMNEQRIWVQPRFTVALNTDDSILIVLRMFSFLRSLLFSSVIILLFLCVFVVVYISYKRRKLSCVFSFNELITLFQIETPPFVKSVSTSSIVEKGGLSSYSEEMEKQGKTENLVFGSNAESLQSTFTFGNFLSRR